MVKSKIAQSDKIGLPKATSLVIGNMIGAGIFLLPASLGAYGSISFIGWLISGLGAIALALVYSRLCKYNPATGGPYIYCKMAFGDFAGFIAAWGYWLSIIPTNAAIAIGFTGYLTVFVPELNQSSYYSSATAIVVLWILTLTNLRGTKTTGTVQLITSIIKITPLLFVSIYGIFFINWENLTAFNISGESNFEAIIATLTLTLFALMGMESATIPADDISEPDKTIPKATMLGTSIVLGIYLVSTFTLMGVMSPVALSASNAPFADGANILFGSTGRILIGIGALISTFGALNGWILLQGQMPLAIAEDGLFPKLFAKRNKKGAPVNAIIISSIIITFLIIANVTKGLVSMFTFMIQITAFTVSIPYLLSAISEVLILHNRGITETKEYLKAAVYGVPAFLYSFWAIMGSGREAVYYGFMFLMLGIPIYIWSKLQKNDPTV